MRVSARDPGTYAVQVTDYLFNLNLGDPFLKAKTKHAVIIVIVFLFTPGCSFPASKKGDSKPATSSGVEFKIDRKVYVVNWSLPDPIPSLKATLRVFNFTSELREFILGSSSCPFDLIITDESGNVLFHLNARRGCTRDLLVVRLTNEHKVFEEVVRLQNRAANPLKSGTYRIEAKGTRGPLGDPVEFTVQHVR